MKSKMKRIPKYVQVKNFIVGLINSGELKVGEKIPSLSHLVQTCKASDTTIKKALSDLAHDGYLKGQWGKGVFIRSRFPGRSNRSITLFVWSDPGRLQHPSNIELMNGIMEECVKANYHLVFTFIDPLVMAADEIEQRVAQVNSAGIMIPFIPGLTDSHLRPLSRAHIPVVFINKPFPAISPYFIGWDTGRLVAEAATQFVLMGGKSIAIIGSPRDESFQVIRRSVEDSLAAIGETLDPRFIRRGPYGIESGKKLMAELLDDGLKPGLVIADDELAGYGVLEALTAHGLKSPADIQILGLGGFLKHGRFKPRVGTISLNISELGRQATSLLLQVIRGEAVSNNSPIVRGSIGGHDTFCLPAAKISGGPDRVP